MANRSWDRSGGADRVRGSVGQCSFGRWRKTLLRFPWPGEPKTLQSPEVRKGKQLGVLNAMPCPPNWQSQMGATVTTVHKMRTVLIFKTNPSYKAFVI